MIDLVSKFCNVGKLVLDTCIGTSETTKAFLQLPGHSRFLDREKDHACFQDALLLPTEVYAKQL